MSKPAYAALAYRDFRLLLAGRFASALGGQMLTFAVAWDLWTRTQSPFALGLIGLSVVLPVITASLPAGVFADHHDRRHIVQTTQTVTSLASAGLAILAWAHGPVAVIFVLLAVLGLVRAFNDPATATLIALVVPSKDYANAATWNSSVYQTAAIAGPAVSGLLVALWNGVAGIYALAAGLALVNFVLVTLIRTRQVKIPAKAATWQSLKEGLAFIKAHKVILAAITLDMWAVLLGGAVALLPIYATNILHVGAWGLGIMRSATSLGALLMALFLAHRPPFQRAGVALLTAVAGFGLVTVAFGLSTWFPLSVVLLFLLGALDNISVVIRSTLMLTQVPDEMRGRTSSVNTIFISSSNELGDFESGMVAGLIGPMAAVVVGGLGTLLVVAAVAKKWPQLTRLKALDAPVSA